MQNTTANGAPLVVGRALIVAAEHQSVGRGDAAELLYREVLAVEPTNVDALLGLAAVRQSSGAHGDAEALLAGALASAPGDARVQAALADARQSAAVYPQRSLARRATQRATRTAIEGVSYRARLWKYRALSTCTRVSGTPNMLQPALLVGPGEIVFGEGVQLGWRRSPLYYTGYCHLEVSAPSSRIELGDRVEFNNNAFIKSEGAGIRVGEDGLFGANVEIFDSNFHDLDPEHRHGGTARMAPVEIERNVFVGMGVKILKGVTIGADSVIGAGAVVSTSIPAGVIAAGNPARVIREL
jgi:maltose O-acetyltransferase